VVGLRVGEAVGFREGVRVGEDMGAFVGFREYEGWLVEGARVGLPVVDGELEGWLVGMVGEEEGCELG